MIRSYHADTSVSYSPTQGITVSSSLDGRVTLYERAEATVVCIAIEQMCHASLTRDIATEQVKFLLGSNMSYVQTSSALPGHAYSKTRRVVASLTATYLRVVYDIRIVAIQLFGLSHIACDSTRVLTMCHDYFRRTSKYLSESLLLGHEHIARAAAHKKFDPWILVRRYTEYLLHIIISSPYEKCIVDMHFPLGDVHALLPSVERSSQRRDIGHIKHRGYSTSSSSPTLGVHVGLVCEPRVAKVYMIIDDTRQKVQPRGINYGISRNIDIGIAADYVLNSLILDNESTRESLTLVDDRSISYDCRRHICYVLSCKYSIFYAHSPCFIYFFCTFDV